MTDQQFDALLRAYFEGDLTPDQESLLHEEVSGAPDRLRRLREEEASWKATHAPSAAALSSLARAKGQWVRRKQGQAFRHVLLGGSIAAAVAALVAVGFLFGNRTERSFHADEPERREFIVEAPLAKQSRICLPDGTRVLLNAGSSLRYTDDFNQTDRSVTLSGEGYFEVTKDPEKPFTVAVGDCCFTVLGTTFTVSAYEGEDCVKAALLEGSIRFESSPENRLTLVPGELVTYDPRTGGTVKRACNVAEYASWTQGAIRYSEIRFPELLRRIAREYNVEIRLATDRFDDCRIRVSFTREDSVSTILASLGEILPIRKKTENDVIIIY